MDKGSVRVSEPTTLQLEVAAKLGIDISGDSANVAAARIREFIEPTIRLGAQVQVATQKQVEFARSLGLDVSGDSVFVAGARIQDALLERNTGLLEELDLQPGDRVYCINRVKTGGKIVEISRQYEVSSIGSDGRIYFRGGRGASAWPSQVEKLE